MEGYRPCGYAGCGRYLPDDTKPQQRYCSRPCQRKASRGTQVPRVTRDGVRIYRTSGENRYE